MSKKNSNANLKNIFEKSKDLNNIFLNFKKNLLGLKSKSFVVAVSGGPDSLALASLTKALSSDNKFLFHYVLINHNIRKNSLKEAFQVKKLLNKFGIKLNVINNKKKITKNVQGEARKVRYKNLIDFSKKKGSKIIITAHNLEDQVETFLIRLSRGSGLTGLSSMSTLTKLEKNLFLYRPLLDVQKKFLIEISKKTFKKYFKDTSNSNQKYLRAKIRNLRIPLKKSGIEYDQIIKSIKNLASSKATIDKYFKVSLKDIIKKKTKKDVEINFNKFSKINIEFKIRIINEAIKKLKGNYYNLRSKKVISLIDRIQSKKFKRTTLGGCIFSRKKEFLSLKIEKT